METLRQSIIKQAELSLADRIGFSSRERFASLPAEANPFTLFPDARTAILIERRITRGTLRGVEEGTNLGDYETFGINWLNDEFLAQSTFDVVRLIERAGWEAMPIIPGKTAGVPLMNGSLEVWPDFAYTAVACGLGEIALGGFVLTQDYGPRQRFHLILTNAELESSPLLVDPVCDQCGECAAICPLQAIDVRNASDLVICGKTMKVAACDPQKCQTCGNGVRGPVDARGMPERTAMLCGRTCIEHLNRIGGIDNRFHNAFRSRPIWIRQQDEE